MFAANLAYLFNILIFIGYLVFYRDGKTWPDQFLWWAWLLYIAHIWFHRFADGLQNTTRNIARIYLIKNHGVNYDKNLVVPIQAALVPDSMLPIIVLWGVVHIGSFTILLFFQGWLMAFIAEFVLIILGGFFPINYQAHLKRVYKYIQNLKSKKYLAFLMAGVSTTELTELLSQAISERRDPQLWWGIVLRDATKEIVKGEVANEKVEHSNHKSIGPTMFMSTYAQQAKEEAAKRIVEMGEPRRPQQNPILQMLELVLLPEGNLDPPLQVDLTDEDWMIFQGMGDLEKVITRLINSETMKIPAGEEELRVWSAKLVELVLTD